MNLPFNIEIMTKNDLDEVTAIENSSFNQPWTLQSFKTDLQYNRLAYYLVARHEDKLVGYIGAWIVLDEAHITTLAVDHAYRRQGVASCLIQALIDEGVRRGISSLTLEVRPSNKVARSFYKKWGFSVRGRRKRYYTDEDALIMSRTEAPRAAGVVISEVESQEV
jgi:ribosomal-protein-alanine N-acetyltransferase